MRTWPAWGTDLPQSLGPQGLVAHPSHGWPCSIAGRTVSPDVTALVEGGGHWKCDLAFPGPPACAFSLCCFTLHLSP